VSPTSLNIFKCGPLVYDDTSTTVFIMVIYFLFFATVVHCDESERAVPGPSPDVSDQTFPGPEYDLLLWAK
jgi:hypothetical protein